MPKAGVIKPTHKAIVSYYQTLQSFDHQHVKHEGALRSAFQTMLADTARTHHWTLVPELSTKAGSKRVMPIQNTRLSIATSPAARMRKAIASFKAQSWLPAPPELRSALNHGDHCRCSPYVRRPKNGS